MKKAFRAIALAALALPALSAGLHADTIPGGDVSGTWYAANSPYYINGSITIQASDTLVIEPGVEVFFLGFYELWVNGVLEAAGTEADSITFRCADGNLWTGIALNGPSAHSLTHCVFLRMYTGVHQTLPGGDVIVSHSRFSNCMSATTWGPGGVGDLRLADCTFYACFRSPVSATSHDGLLEISNCEFRSNIHSSLNGGAIFDSSRTGELRITGSIFDANRCPGEGGAIYCGGSGGGVVVINGCTFSGNIAESWYTGGGAIFLHNTAMDISRSVFYGNIAPNVDPTGRGIFMHFPGSLTLDHCAFFDGGFNICTAGSSDSLSSLTITNSIMGDGAVMNFDPANVSVRYSNRFAIDGSAPPGYLVKVDTNHNGDSCDIYFNIFMDPLFVDTASHNYHLLATSPCIDAGDPLFAYDPDGTITDMGAYWFDQNLPVVALSDTALDFDSVYVGEQASLGLKIYNQGTADLMISGLANSLTVFTTDYDPADSLILPGDSLALTVIFTPADSIAYADTLQITTNDRNLTVVLGGTGLPPTGVAGPSTPLGIPAVFRLCATRPNPARSAATIAYQLPKASRVTLEIYDIAGRMVKQFDQGVKQPGHHSIKWNAREHGAGVYFCRLRAGAFESTKKAVIVK